MVTVPNTDLHTHVETCSPVRNNNGTVFSDAFARLYVVYSYGTHWPLYIYDVDTGVWFENTSSASRTTSRHRSHARPRGVKTVQLPVEEMYALRDAGSYAAYSPAATEGP